MALVKNISTHPLDLTDGRIVDPSDTINADLSLPHEADLVASGRLVVTNPSTDPPAPATRNVPVVAPIPYTDSARTVTLDISGEATDAEVAAAIAAIGGRFRGAYASLTSGAIVKANDVVTNPSGALVSRIADGTISGSYNPANWTALSAGSSGLTPTAVKTANYTAVAGDLVRVDTTGGAVTVTLPAAVAGATVGVKLTTLGGSNAVTIAAAGSDVFNKTGGATTLTLSLLNQGVVLAAVAGVWVVQADDLPLTQLDSRYRSVPNGGTIDQVLTKLSGADGDAAWSNLPISVVESVNTVAAAGAAQTLVDVTTATVHALTLTAANCTLTFPSLVAGKGFTVVLKQDATAGRTVTWPGTVAWAGGVTPVLSSVANGVDVFSFLTVDGTTWLGFTRSQATAARPYRAAVLADTPVSYWRLGEASGSAVKDEMGVNNGTYVGDYTLAQSGLLNSEADKAAKFGGTNAHAVVKSGAILAGLTNWTVEAWIKTSTTGKIIYAERGSTGNDIIEIDLTPQLRLTYRDHAGALNQPATTATANDGNIHHIVVTKQGTTVKFYIDGAQSGSTATLTASDTMGEPTIATWLGADPTGSAYWNGLLDEVAVYNTALSAARIAAHYAAGIALP